MLSLTILNGRCCYAYCLNAECQICCVTSFIMLTVVMLRAVMFGVVALFFRCIMYIEDIDSHCAKGQEEGRNKDGHVRIISQSVCHSLVQNFPIRACVIKISIMVVSQIQLYIDDRSTAIFQWQTLQLIPQEC